VLSGVDIYEKDDKIIMKAEIPRVTPKDIKLLVDGSLLIRDSLRNLA